MNGVFNRGELIGGKYRIGRWLAKGGMGSVWIAQHVDLGNEVAIKAVTAAEDDQLARVRFKREARAAAGLKSPHVVRVFDYGIAGTTPYLVMELLQGEDLKDRFRGGGPMSHEAICRVIEQTADALHEAHEVGLVHRDVKPRNIFLAKEGAHETVKLLDFGVAKVIEGGGADDTRTGMLVGSPRYMSPEQAAGEKVDRRSDVWSLGVVAFELLTGRPPFSGGGVSNVLTMLLRDDIPRICAVAPDLPAELDVVMDMALVRDRSARCGDPREFASALRRVLIDGQAAPLVSADEPTDEQWAGREDETASAIAVEDVTGSDFATIDQSTGSGSGSGSDSGFGSRGQVDALGEPTASESESSSSLDGTGVTAAEIEPPVRGRESSGRSKLWLLAAALVATAGVVGVMRMSGGDATGDGTVASAAESTSPPDSAVHVAEVLSAATSPSAAAAASAATPATSVSASASSASPNAGRPASKRAQPRTKPTKKTTGGGAAGPIRENPF